MKGQLPLRALLLASLFLPNKVLAEAPSNTNIAGPSASATGNVTNQAIQVLQGPYPITTFGGGVSCPGPALTIAPFITGNLNNNTEPGTYQGQSASGGFTIGFSTPLNGSITETCLDAARAQTERNQIETAKGRLDFELVRAIRCGELMRAGVRFHPSSPYSAVCADIIVVNPPAPEPAESAS